jgi:PleD family two-component response regulator
VAAAREGDTSLDQVIARADQALYAAKQAGRNRLQAA